ncbi:MAG TPA: hypothetical protein VJX73_10120 [Terracidiphilus sp.]|nr:hypothetical protein [Terracidiphilus sp.]
MKKSLLTSGAADRIHRMCRLVFPAILVLGATAAMAQQNDFVGQWRGVASGMTITLVVQPNGRFTMTEQSSALMTQQSGPYRLVAPNTIVFTVEDWQPRTMPVYHPTGTVGGYYTQEPMAKPPDGLYSYVFNGPNTVVLTDQVMHVSITMTRVP